MTPLTRVGLLLSAILVLLYLDRMVGAGWSGLRGVGLACALVSLGIFWILAALEYCWEREYGRRVRREIIEEETEEEA